MVYTSAVSRARTSPDDDFWMEWISPFYLKILHGNYALVGSDDEFAEKVKVALKNVTPKIVETLFSGPCWRGRITAAWFCGMKNWKQYQDKMGDDLIESRYGFAGQGYSFALARFCDEKSAAYLVRYLDLYLAQIDHFPDHGWVIGALLWIDEKQRTDHAARFIVPGGPWDQFAAAKGAANDHWELERCRERFYKVMNASITLSR